MRARDNLKRASDVLFSSAVGASLIISHGCASRCSFEQIGEQVCTYISLTTPAQAVLVYSSLEKPHGSLGN